MKDESIALNNEIKRLQTKQADELQVLREQFFITYDSLKPINLIKSMFSQVVASPEIKGNLMDTVIGMTTGYLSRKILTLGTAGPVRKIIGVLLQFAVTNVVSKHSEKIKQYGEGILEKVFSKKNDHEENYHEHVL